MDASLSEEEAAQVLKRDQFAAAGIAGVKEHDWLGCPEAGEYNYFDVRRDLLKYIHMSKPDFVFTCDPGLTCEAHHDHIQTGLTKIASSHPEIDSACEAHDIQGMAFYFTREPNLIAGISATWEDKVSVLRCYEAQFDAPGMEQLIMAVDLKSQQAAQGQSFARGGPLKVLHTSALHVGIYPSPFGGVIEYNVCERQ